MLTTAISRRAKGLIVGAAILGSSAIAMTARADRFDGEQKGTCAYTIYLQDPMNRATYLNELAQAKRASQHRYGSVEEMYGNVVRTSYRGDEQVELDVFSAGCLSCHDGSNGPAYTVRFKNNPQDRQVDIHSVVDSHPIGMDYEAYTEYDRSLRSMDDMPKEMSFVGGKVGCLTCHNPLNPERYHLAKNNERSALCFTCHNK